MNNLIKTLIPLAALIVLVGFGFAYIWKNGYPTDLEAPFEQVEEISAKQAPKAPDIRKDFENLLNEFLTSIATQAREYKKQRKILFELSGPENLREVSYIKENYNMSQELIPVLHKKMDILIKHFEIVEAQIYALLKGQSEETYITIIKEWKALKAQQAAPYVEFFAFEAEILTLYEELMNFYYLKQNDYRVDMERGEIIFTNKEDKKMRDEILQKISLFSRKQALALTNSPMKK